MVYKYPQWQIRFGNVKMVTEVCGVEIVNKIAIAVSDLSWRPLGDVFGCLKPNACRHCSASASTE